MRPDTGMMGNNFFESCRIDTWLEFCSKEVEEPCCLLVWLAKGLIPKASLGSDAQHEAAVISALYDVDRALKKLEAQLKASGVFVLGKEVTLADVGLFCALQEAMTTVLEQGPMTKNFPLVTKWFA